MVARDGEVPAGVLDRVDLRRVHVGRGVAVADRGVLVEGGLPQLVDDLHVLLGQLVALGGCQSLHLPEVARRGFGVGGHDVPADPAVGEVVEAAVPARQQVGLLVGQRAGHPEGQMLGHRGHPADQHRRVVDRELGRIPHRRVARPAVHVVHPDGVGEEDAVETGVLEHPRRLDPVLQIGVPVTLIPLGTPGPRRQVRRCENIESEQAQRSILHGSGGLSGSVPEGSHDVHLMNDTFKMPC